MALTRIYKVFFAIPFDAAIKSMYDSIIEDLKGEFAQDFQFSYGTTSVIEPSGSYSRIEEFRAQNQDFLTRFVKVIESNDVVVADLTNNNASVHLELGIALTLNKNILRVSGRDLIDVASDLRGYEVGRYAGANQLHAQIRYYLSYFLTIKRLPRILTIPDWEDIGPPTTDPNTLNRYQFTSRQISEKMRDGEVRVNFRFNATVDDGDWFSILLRTEIANPWLGGGYFVFARRNGSLEVHRMGTIELLGLRTDHPPLVIGTEHVLRVIIDGNHLFTSLDEELERGIHIEGLENQSPGNVILGCYRSWAAFRNLELGNHDTIAFR